QDVLSLRGHEDQVFAVAFSPEGSLLATGGETGVLRLWEIWSGEEVLRWKAHPYGITSLVFSRDGKTLVSASWDETIRAWDPATGRQLGVLRGHRGDVACVRLSPDGRTLASAGGDSTILFWNVADLGWDSKSKTEDVPSSRLEVLWKDLAGGDARRAHRAIDRLTRSSQVSLGFLREKLRLPPDPLCARIQAKVRDLDHSEFDVRERANKFLMQNGEEARPALMKALQDSPSPELRERATAILSVPHWPFQDFPNHLLGRQRAMRVLERVGTNEARALLKSVAESSPWSIEKRHALGALGRLDAQASVN
ncbi:MAG: hypothetical protein IH987_07085, partial [Planctomycetes bacterium]|nr:hypothetical protein [Planctomycetota bacterium]